MELTAPPLPRDIWAATPCAAQVLIVALQERVRELEARLGQNASNSSRPRGCRRGGTPGIRAGITSRCTTGGLNDYTARNEDHES